MRTDWPLFGRDVRDAAWRPEPDAASSTRLGRFVRAAGETDLDALQLHAECDPAWFWQAAADDLQLAWQRQPLQTLDLSRGPEWSRWWSGGSFNYAAAAVDPRAQRDPNGAALTWEGEDGNVRRFTNVELKTQVDLAAGMFVRLGVSAGDRVGIFLPLLPETVFSVLALGKLKAIYIPIFSGYAAPAVASRLNDAGATLLVTADGTLRRGTKVDMKRTADEAVAQSPTVRNVLVVGRLGQEPAHQNGADEKTRWWSVEMADPGLQPLAAAPETDPETPYMVIYTSGTTGKPKGAVHVHGGFPIKGAQDLAHCFDLRPGDRLFWFTDLGWMMGPWAISGALLLGAELVLYEGAPDYPSPDRLWDLVARHAVTHLGLSPTVIRALMAHGTEPIRGHDLSALRVLGSTGEPWNPESWWWFFNNVGGGRLPIVNYSGGTEVSGGILSCNLLTPIKPTSFGGPSVGTAADVIDGRGASVRGIVGELAIRQPLPGMTRGFWQDLDRYIETYWSRVPGTWVHGDWAIVDEDGYWFIQGRSDDTLKVAGKRVGPAEVESAAVAHPAVLEAAAVGVPHDVKGEVIVVFVRLRPGEQDDPELRRSISDKVVEQMGKALKPEAIHVVSDLPRTRSGKIMRRVARAAYLGADPGDLSALDNPLAVESIRSAAHSRGGASAVTPTITSTANPRVKAAARLRGRRERDREGLTLIDGVRETLRALAAGATIKEVFLLPEALQGTEASALLERLAEERVPVIELGRDAFEKLAYGDRLDGVVAVAETPPRTLDELLLPVTPLIGIVEGVEKPGNLGAILRSADGAGVNAIIVADTATDLFNPNIIRASIGTVFALPVAVASSGDVLTWLRARAIDIIAARLDGSVDYARADYRGAVAIALGSEARGLSDAWGELARASVKLPMLGLADSLNVSATAAVLFYEAMRQRR